MDAVSLKLARNYTNEKLNSLPSNRPTKTVSFDGGIYSVGNDVVNGQVSVVVKGNSLTVFGDAIALDSNGDGLADNWAQVGTTYSYDTTEKAQLVNCRYNNIHLQRNVGTPLIAGHVYAHLFELKKTSSTTSELHIGVGTSGAAGASQNRVSILNANYNETDYVRVCKKFSFSTVAAMNNTVYFSGYNGTPCNAKIRKYNLIDLTAHGLDELSEVEILSMIPYWLPTGTKSTNSVRIRSVNEDETKESIAYANLPQGEELRSLPNGVKDEFNATTGIKTQRVGVKENVASGTVINYVDMATDGQFVAYYAGGTSQTGVKGDTLTALAVTLTYQLATPIVTKLPAQAPLQVFENGTVYVEPIGDPAESTVPSVEMTIPTGTSNKFGVASHDYDGAAADWTLTNSESKCFLLAVSSAGDAANIIAPDAPGTMYAISNASGQTVTIKISGGAGVAVVDSKTVLVIHNGTDYTALTAEL